jgi:hypothetical protein
VTTAISPRSRFSPEIISSFRFETGETDIYPNGHFWAVSVQNECCRHRFFLNFSSVLCPIRLVGQLPPINMITVVYSRTTPEWSSAFSKLKSCPGNCLSLTDVLLLGDPTRDLIDPARKGNWKMNPHLSRSELPQPAEGRIPDERFLEIPPVNARC